MAECDDDDEDEDTPLKTRLEEEDDEEEDEETLSPPDDDDRLDVWVSALGQSLRSRLLATAEETALLSAWRLRLASSLLGSNDDEAVALRVSRWWLLPDTTPLHLSHSTCRGRSLMAFMMDVGSS